ncbi:hypothetical protein DASC09_031570 [Saccharomycopsis crataegensis]|uniref:FMR1-interacting protein 1 conserved domain-containing protein n=1 Tax=Saccharomycopsis crataegensis TaxID=43959 RepID=A0AAV5QM20_9ASCO|nr:hypothetical protein DASC09_031570 [Saccharomycopsis crataegensis]
MKRSGSSDTSPTTARKLHKPSDSWDAVLDILPTHLPGTSSSSPVVTPGISVKENNNTGESNGTKTTQETMAITKQQPVPIAGTNIVLSTEDDIAKWIEERKKNYPTSKRMQEKKLEKERTSKVKPPPKAKGISLVPNTNNKAAMTKKNVQINNKPQKPMTMAMEGRIKEVLPGITAFVPNKLTHRHHYNTAMEKSRFQIRLHSQQRREVHEQLLEFIQDLCDSGVIEHTEL